MSDATKSEGNLTESNPPPATNETAQSAYIVIGAVLLGMAAVAAYQFFSCAGCYGGL